MGNNITTTITNEKQRNHKNGRGSNSIKQHGQQQQRKQQPILTSLCHVDNTQYDVSLRDAVMKHIHYHHDYENDNSNNPQPIPLLLPLLTTTTKTTTKTKTITKKQDETNEKENTNVKIMVVKDDNPNNSKSKKQKNTIICNIDIHIIGGYYDYEDINKDH